MSAKKPRFRITPSLLNKWQDLVDCDRHWEEWYGNSDEPTISSEDYYAKCEQDLLNAINRVPFVSEAASRGTALNELIDCGVEKRRPREGVTIQKIYRDAAPGEKQTIHSFIVSLDGFTFHFDAVMVFNIWRKFRDAICQYRCEAVMDTSFGPVILYGDADYILRDVVYDLKTTSKYNAYGKFEDGWQKDLYPWALIESGDMEGITGFEYTIVPLSGGNATTPIITGEIKSEWYDYSHGMATRRLRQVLEAFLPWIEEHRSLITHPRIFNEE